MEWCTATWCAELFKNLEKREKAQKTQNCRTNGQIEAHFRFIKQDLLCGRLRLRPSEFLTEYLKDIRGRINERKMPNIGKGKKGKRELLSVEEKWKKRRKESKYTD